MNKIKKLRGKKRYYRNLMKLDVPVLINFEDENKNWFDFFHEHVINKDIKNNSIKSRIQHLEALFSLAQKYEHKLTVLKREFQFWINVNNMYKEDDAIYIHTKNPNESEFPIKVEDYPELKTDSTLEQYLNTKGYSIICFPVFDENNAKSINYYLYKENLGISLKM